MAGLEFIDPNGERGFVVLHCPRFVIGRASDCDLTLDDAWASRRHMAIVVDDEGVHEMQDLGSGNGTRWNAEVHGSHILTDGDILRVGRTSLTYRASDSTSRAQGSEAQSLRLAQAQAERLQTECETLRSLIGERGGSTPDGATLLQPGPTRLNPQMDLRFPVHSTADCLSLGEPSSWAHFGVGPDALAFGAALLDVGQSRLVVFVDEMLPNSRVPLQSRCVRRLHGDDGVLQSLVETLSEAEAQIIEFVVAEGVVTDLFLLTGSDVYNDSSGFVAALSLLSDALRVREETRSVRLHLALMGESVIDEEARESCQVLMRAGRLSSAFVFQESRSIGDGVQGHYSAAAGALDLLSWLPRMEAIEGGLGDGGLASHLSTGGFVAMGLAGSTSANREGLEAAVSVVLTQGLMAEGFSAATAMSAVVVCLVGQDDLRADDEALGRVREALRSVEQQLPQAQVNRAIYVVPNDGVRLFVVLFGLT